MSNPIYENGSVKKVTLFHDAKTDVRDHPGPNYITVRDFEAGPAQAGPVPGSCHTGFVKLYNATIRDFTVWDSHGPASTLYFAFDEALEAQLGNMFDMLIKQSEEAHAGYRGAMDKVGFFECLLDNVYDAPFWSRLVYLFTGNLKGTEQ